MEVQGDTTHSADAREDNPSPRGEILAGIDGVHASATGLAIDAGLALEDWKALVSRLVPLESEVPWWVGDAIIYAEKEYGRAVAYTALREATGRADHTLENRASVARAVPADVRRGDLSWTHHREVARLEPEEQREWLARARAEGWTSKKLGRMVRGEDDDDEDVDDDDLWPDDGLCPTCKQPLPATLREAA